MDDDAADDLLGADAAATWVGSTSGWAIELVEITAERVVATMPVEGNTQPYGLLHGGASVVLAETLGSVGSAIHGYPDRVPVGVDINATHHRAARSGTVTGVATAVHLGRTMATLRGGHHRRGRQAGLHRRGSPARWWPKDRF